MKICQVRYKEESPSSRSAKLKKKHVSDTQNPPANVRFVSRNIQHIHHFITQSNLLQVLLWLLLLATCQF